MDTDSSLNARAGLLASLVAQPGWAEYVKLLDEQIDAEVLRFARQAMQTEHGGVSEGDLQYRRGVIRGLQQATRAAHGARLRFDRTEEEPSE